MQRHVNDWVGTLKAAIPFLQILQCGGNEVRAIDSEKFKNLADVLHEATDIVQAAEDARALMGVNKPTFESELKSLINRYSKEAGSNTPDFILAAYLVNTLNIFDIAIQDRAKWHGEVLPRAGCPKPEELKTKEEKKAEELRKIHASPYGANLGINSPEIVPGLKFANIHMPAHSFHVLKVDTEKNSVRVQMYKTELEAGCGWCEDWNLDHTRIGFSRGEYWEVMEPLNEELTKAGITQRIHICPFCSHKHFGTVARGNIICNNCKNIFPVLGRDWQAEALKKRQFPTGGVIGEMRRQAGREIMADIEATTLQTCDGHKVTIQFVPADLWEEYEANNRAMQRLWNRHETNTKEYAELSKKCQELQARISTCKKEALKQEAADNFSELVANALKVTRSFTDAAKAAAQYSKASKEARAEMEAVKNAQAKPITDKNGFLFVSRDNEILWALHTGEKYCFCRWENEGYEWVGWKVNEADVNEATKTRLVGEVDQFLRGIWPTK